MFGVIVRRDFEELIIGWIWSWSFNSFDCHVLTVTWKGEKFEKLEKVRWMVFVCKTLESSVLNGVKLQLGNSQHLNSLVSWIAFSAWTSSGSQIGAVGENYIRWNRHRHVQVRAEIIERQRLKKKEESRKIIRWFINWKLGKYSIDLCPKQLHTWERFKN